MSKLQHLLKNARKGRDIQSIHYGEFPTHIAGECGPEEIVEILHRLDRLAIDKEELEDWDGDSKDDIWRDQKGFASIISSLLNKFPLECQKGLSSEQSDTRFWLAWALIQEPSPQHSIAISNALAKEQIVHVRQLLEKALLACRKS